ncbi:MAG: hypothetical protein ACOCTT_03740 [archaeon]
MRKKETITIKDIGRKKRPSNDVAGELYTITTVMDEQGRIITGFGEWTENWEIGDKITGILETKFNKEEGGNITKEIIIKKIKE